MNKIFAILLSALMLLAGTAALAESAEDANILKFTIQMDKLPEGYRFSSKEVGDSIVGAFYTEDPEALTVYVSVSESVDFAGFTFDHDLSEEEMARVSAALTEDYVDPTVEVRETTHGTRIVLVNENGADSDYADMVTVWHGYVIAIGLQKPTEITEDDVTLATQLVSDLWVVEK